MLNCQVNFTMQQVRNRLLYLQIYIICAFWDEICISCSSWENLCYNCSIRVQQLELSCNIEMCVSWMKPDTFVSRLSVLCCYSLPCVKSSVLSCNVVFFGGVTFSYIFVCLLLLNGQFPAVGRDQLNSISCYSISWPNKQITKMCIISGKEHEWSVQYIEVNCHHLRVFFFF